MKILAAMGGIAGVALAAALASSNARDLQASPAHHAHHAPMNPAAHRIAVPTTNPATHHIAVLAVHMISDAAGRGSAPVAASPMADIAELYAWSSGSNLNLVMGVSPLDSGGSGFDPSIVYVFHLTSKPGRYVPGSTVGIETQVRCRFASNTSVECWAVRLSEAVGEVHRGSAAARTAETQDYVTGDPSNPTGVISPRGTLRVFAGPRSNPASFNQSGFAAAVAAIEAVPAMPQPDPAGCPHPDAFDMGRALGVRAALQTGSDTFAATNVMAIVVQVDSSLVNHGGNTIVAVWASTHAGL